MVIDVVMVYGGDLLGSTVHEGGCTEDGGATCCAILFDDRSMMVDVMIAEKRKKCDMQCLKVEVNGKRIAEGRPWQCPACNR